MFDLFGWRKKMEITQVEASELLGFGLRYYKYLESCTRPHPRLLEPACTHYLDLKTRGKPLIPRKRRGTAK